MGELEPKGELERLLREIRLLTRSEFCIALDVLDGESLAELRRLVRASYAAGERDALRKFR